MYLDRWSLSGSFGCGHHRYPDLQLIEQCFVEIGPAFDGGFDPPNGTRSLLLVALEQSVHDMRSPMDFRVRFHSKTVPQSSAEKWSTPRFQLWSQNGGIAVTSMSTNDCGITDHFPLWSDQNGEDFVFRKMCIYEIDVFALFIVSEIEDAQIWKRGHLGKGQCPLIEGIAQCIECDEISKLTNLDRDVPEWVAADIEMLEWW